MTSAVVQPETTTRQERVAASRAALPPNFLSGLEYRIFNDISPTIERTLRRVFAMPISLWPFRGKRPKKCRRPDSGRLWPFLPAAQALGDQNGIAIRACFGKPAFAIMQHGRGGTSPFPSAFRTFSMIFGLFSRRSNNRQIVDRQYEALTTAARQPLFYSAFGVPDTVMGRLEMISLVMIL